jgi:hypothetical protein
VYKEFTASIVLTFLLVFSSFADVGQVQGYLIGADNGVPVAGDQQGSDMSVRNAAATNTQEATDPSGRVGMVQGADATIIRDAIGVDQDAGVIGEQWRFAPTWSSLGLQLPDLNTDIWQGVYDIGELGSVFGIQEFMGDLVYDKGITYHKCGP